MSQNRRQPPDELMEKKRMLDENEQLRQLYRALVPTSIISVDEFWKEIAGQYKQSMGPQQDVGVSGAFLVSIVEESRLERCVMEETDTEVTPLNGSLS